jgi:hypothetical protein
MIFRRVIISELVPNYLVILFSYYKIYIIYNYSTFLQFNATIFPVACEASVEINQDFCSGKRQKNESMLFARMLWVYIDV